MLPGEAVTPMCYLVKQSLQCATWCSSHFSVLPGEAVTPMCYLVKQSLQCVTWCSSHFSVLPGEAVTPMCYLVKQSLQCALIFITVPLPVSCSILGLGTNLLEIIHIVGMVSIGHICQLQSRVRNKFKTITHISDDFVIVILFM